MPVHEPSSHTICNHTCTVRPDMCSMNLAARLETSCPPGRIHVSAATARLLPEEGWEPVGGVELKGQGRVVSSRGLLHNSFVDNILFL
jgi:hypothetical protein